MLQCYSTLLFKLYYFVPLGTGSRMQIPKFNIYNEEVHKSSDRPIH